MYILTNNSNHVLYIGVTNNLVKRTYDHKNSSIASFSAKYHVNKLVYYEGVNDITEAIQREKQLKGGSRLKKIALIRKLNPEFKDLYSSII